MVTNHAPQMKYWRNIIAERRVRTIADLGWGRREVWPHTNVFG